MHSPSSTYASFEAECRALLSRLLVKATTDLQAWSLESPRINTALLSRTVGMLARFPLQTKLTTLEFRRAARDVQRYLKEAAFGRAESIVNPIPAFLRKCAELAEESA